MKSYETEARERWGNIDAYREHEQKTKNYTKEKWTQENDGLMGYLPSLPHERIVAQRMILTKHRRL